MRLSQIIVLTFALLAAATWLRVSLAQEASSATSWELTPYRVEISVIIEPSARLAPALEAELTQQLVALADAANGGPWQVSAGKPLAKGRSRALQQLALLDDSPELKAQANVDKLLVVGVQETTSGFRVIARELDVASGFWNLPVERTIPQASRIAAEGLAAIQAAWGPVVRIDTIEKDTVTVTLRGGSLPKRDGTLLSIDRNAALGLYTLQTDKTGRPNPETATQIIWSFLVPIAGTSGSGGSSKATFKCRLHTALEGNPLPDYHPLQPRLARAYAKSTATTKIMLVDKESPQPPLEGYEVSLAPIDGNAASTAPTRIGVTNRQGEVTLPAGDGSLRRLIISHGGEELCRRPFLPGLRSEARLSLPNDRRRLELAAEIAAAEDELFDALGRLAVVTARAEDAVKRRDLAAGNRVAADQQSALGALAALANRVGTLEQQLASVDEGTRRRLEPVVAQFKAKVDVLKSAFASASR